MNQLFTEIKTRMPRNNPATLGDETLPRSRHIHSASERVSARDRSIATRDSAVLSGLMIQKEKGAPARRAVDGLAGPGGRVPFTRRCGLVADQCDRAASDR